MLCRASQTKVCGVPREGLIERSIPDHSKISKRRGFSGFVGPSTVVILVPMVQLEIMRKDLPEGFNTGRLRTSFCFFRSGDIMNPSVSYNLRERDRKRVQSPLQWKEWSRFPFNLWTNNSGSLTIITNKVFGYLKRAMRLGLQDWGTPRS